MSAPQYARSWQHLSVVLAVWGFADAALWNRTTTADKELHQGCHGDDC